jgi:thiol-disulfide isomerase/thioredoxin
MFRHFRFIVGCVVVGFLSGLAAFAQTPTAGAAKPIAGVPRYIFDAREALKQGSDHDKCPPACFMPTPADDGRSFRRTRFTFFTSGIEIREIDLDGLKKLLLRDPKNPRPLLINFWATWCDGCREEFPDLVKIDNDYRAKGLNFLSITLDEVADKTKAVDFLTEMKATMPVVLLNVNDPEPAIHAVDEKWDGALPATFLFDREGKIVFKYYGKIKPAELRAAIDKAVGSKQ